MSSATQPQTTGAQRAAARLAAKVAAHPPISHTHTRQFARASKRRAGRTAPRSLGPKPQRIGGKGSYNRSLVTLSETGAAVERYFHFTKGHRSRRVSL